MNIPRFASDTIVFTSITAVAFSIIVNFCLTCMIVARIKSRQSSIRAILGKAHHPMYKRAITLCVESCGLILVFEVAEVIFLFIPTDTDRTGFLVSSVLYTLLPHVFVSCISSSHSFIYIMRDRYYQLFSLSVGWRRERTQQAHIFFAP